MRTLTRKQARKEGYTIDDCAARGPIGYKGARFAPNADLVSVLSEREEILLKHLRMARDHLDWIGWGDSYERSAIQESGIITAIKDCDNNIEGDL